MVSQVPSPRPGPMSAPPSVSGDEHRDRSVRGPDVLPSSEDILSFLTPSQDTGTLAHLESGTQDAVTADDESFAYSGYGDIVAMVRRGFPVVALENLVVAVGVPQKEIVGAIGMPATTLGRRRRSGRLTPVESDQLVRVARLAAMAQAMMAGDADATRRWLTTPHPLLDDETPLRRASTEAGGREVEQLIGQLRHGVFS